MPPRRVLRVLAVCLFLAAASPIVWAADDQPAAPDAVRAMVSAGQFARADAAITAALAQEKLPEDQRRAYLWQRERMRRMRMDFSLDRDQAMARLRQSVPDLTAAEFAAWDARGYLESLVIDGQTRYFRRGISNLFLLNEQARARRSKPLASSDSPLQTFKPYHAKVRDAAVAAKASHVLPRRVRVTQTLTVDADAVPAGETLRAWIPFPQALPGQQEAVHLVATRPAKHQLAKLGTPMRTVYFEQVAKAGKPSVFKLTYELTLYAQYTAVDPDRVVPVQASAELAPYLAERPPHMLFSEQLRLFSRQVVGTETNPWRIAQKLFAAVDQIPWAGAREYSTIANLSQYALHAGHADCGQQTMLLMTLLRMNGIPTRWQSGAMFSAGDYWNIHDWAWLYIAPYGWLPMDVTFGRLDSADPALAGFYLGGLDGYRIAFNNDFGRPLVPAKQHFRSDNVDSQRGEVEWRGGNLYYDQWGYNLEWHFLDEPMKSPDEPTTSTRGESS